VPLTQTPAKSLGTVPLGHADAGAAVAHRPAPTNSAQAPAPRKIFTLLSLVRCFGLWSCRKSPLLSELLTSGRLFGYLARRPGNRATTARCPRGRAGMALLFGGTCKWWVPEGGTAGTASNDR